MKATPNLVDFLVNELDNNQSGTISYEIFLNYCFLSQIILKEVNLRKQFDKYDEGKTGAI